MGESTPALNKEFSLYRNFQFIFEGKIKKREGFLELRFSDAIALQKVQGKIYSK